jgi:hypothetical protein
MRAPRAPLSADVVYYACRRASAKHYFAAAVMRSLFDAVFASYADMLKNVIRRAAMLMPQRFYAIMLLLMPLPVAAPGRREARRCRVLSAITFR